MTISEVIHLGDKIDIRLIQQVEAENKDGTATKLYKSQVLDIKEDGNLEISMPIEAGKLLLLPLGVRFEFVFYSSGGLYRAVGLIKQRYKKDNVYMLEVELKSQLEKFQRREFFRFSCLLDFKYYKITDEHSKLESIDEIFLQIRDDDFYGKVYEGQIVDLSGGGLKFNTVEELTVGSYLLYELHLQNDIINKQYYIVGEIISCRKMENIQEKKFQARGKFLIKDDRVRENIIRYIFEEERRTRQKEKR